MLESEGKMQVSETFSTKASMAVCEPRRPCAFSTARRTNGMDVFFILNGGLFLLMCGFAYFDRWTQYAGRSPVAVMEFFFYATVLMTVIGGLWLWLRRYAVPGWLLLLIELGIVAHFAGGLVHFGGARLYDHIYFGLRYDKYVHFANAWIGALTVQEICRLKGQPINAFTRILFFFGVLGLGGLVEVCEFIAMLTIPRNGVGGYADTMGDLIANACGGAAFLACRGRLPFLTR